MNRELLLFARALWYGAAMLVAYDCLRILREVISHKGWVIGMEDILYWAISSLFIFTGLYGQNSGVLRGYFFVGMALGMIVYSWTFSSYFVKGASYLLNRLKKILKIPVKAAKKVIKRLKSAALRGKLSMSKFICRKAPKGPRKDGWNGKKIRKIRKSEGGSKQSPE